MNLCVFYNSRNFWTYPFGGLRRVQHFGAKNAYGCGASTRQSACNFARIPALCHRKISRAGAAVLQIPRAKEQKFDIKRDAKFGAPSTAALVL
jgi:hypothetical protein